MSLLRFVLFVGISHAAIQDDAVCEFNRFRKENEVPPFAIALNLMKSAQAIADASNATKKPMVMMPGDAGLYDRFERAGYSPSAVNALTTMRIKNGKTFAQKMIRDFPEIIKDPQYHQIGVAKVGAYWNLDLGDTYEEDEPTKSLYLAKINLKFI